MMQRDGLPFLRAVRPRSQLFAPFSLWKYPSQCMSSLGTRLSKKTLCPCGWIPHHEPLFSLIMEKPSLTSRLWHDATVRMTALGGFWLAGVLCFQSVPAALRWPVRVLWLLVSFWLVCLAARLLWSTRFTVKKVVFSLLILGINWLCLSLVCLVFNALMSKKDDRLTTHGMATLSDDCRKGIEAMIAGKSMSGFSKEIGWLPRPGYKSGSYTINAQGVRSPREYPLKPADPSRRFLCMGDSFTFGTAVDDTETFPAQAEALLPGSEWLNFGMPSTCLVQSYLRYIQDGRKYGGKHVIIGFMSNDAQRTVNCFRPFLNHESGAPMTKPFAKLDAGRFTLEPNPYSSLDDYRRLLGDEHAELTKLYKLDYLTWSGGQTLGNPVLRTFEYVYEARRLDENLDGLVGSVLPVNRWIRWLLPENVYGRAIYDTRSKGFQALTAMFERYHDQVVSDGLKPFIVVFPGPLDVEAFQKKQSRQYTSLIEFLQSKHYAYLDFLDPLTARHKDDLSYKAIYVNNHYQGHINKEVAAEIIKAVKP